MLLACPVCLRRKRIWVCDQVAPLVCASPGEWVRVSLVLHRFRLSAGSLHQFDPQHLISAFRRVLKPFLKKQRLIVYDGVDYCVDVVREYHHCPIRKRSYDFRFYWVPHLYVLVKIAPEDRAALSSCLRWFSQSEFVDRPANIQPLFGESEDALKVITYALKSRFYARHKPDGLSKSRKSKRPKKQRMHGMCQAELAACLASHALKDRMILIGMKRHQQTIMITDRSWRKNGLI